MDQQLKPTILYAEDDVDDFESLDDAIHQLSDKYRLVHALNGTEVIEKMQSELATHHPCMIILDLNMPIMGGKEVLNWLKTDPRFEDIPVMVFTTSSREEDMKLCQSHRCSFFRKPTLYRDLLHIAQTMIDICDAR